MVTELSSGKLKINQSTVRLIGGTEVTMEKIRLSHEIHGTFSPGTIVDEYLGSHQGITIIGCSDVQDRRPQERSDKRLVLPNSV